MDSRRQERRERPTKRWLEQQYQVSLRVIEGLQLRVEELEDRVEELEESLIGTQEEVADLEDEIGYPVEVD